MVKVVTSLAISGILATSIFSADKLNGAGATFPAIVYYDWAYNYNKETKTEVNYQSIGSGGGIKQIKARTVDFGATDSPLTPEELKKMVYINFQLLLVV